MTSSDHPNRPVICLDEDEDFVETDIIKNMRDEDVEIEGKKLKAASVIIRNLNSRLTKPGRDSLQTLKEGVQTVQSYFRSGVDKNTKNTTTTNSNKHNDNSSTLPPGLDQLNDLIIKAEYECTQDPYRGIGRLRQQWQQQQNVQDQSSSKEVDKEDIPVPDEPSLRETNGDNVPPPAEPSDESLSTSLSGTTPPKERPRPRRKNVSPWDACQWGILSTRGVVDDSRTKEECWSPSKAQSEDLSPTSGPSSSCDSFAVLEPYNAENVVKCLTESCCPSLLAWTKHRIEQDSKAMSQQTRKRRNGSKRSRSESDGGSGSLEVRLGQRPSGTNYRCPCDSNPYCLVSLGGVVNDILRERCDDVKVITTGDDDNSNMVDKDTNRDDNRNGKRKKAESEPPTRLQRWLDDSTDSARRKKTEEIWNRNLISKISVFSDPEDSPDDGDDEVEVVGAEVVESPTQFPNSTDSNNTNKENNPISSNIRNTDAVAMPIADVGSAELNLLNAGQQNSNERDGSGSLPDVAAGTLSYSCLPTKQTFVVGRCKRLPPPSSNLPARNHEDNPGDVYFSTVEDELINPYTNETNYSRDTQDELDRLRISQDLERSQIEEFVRAILERVQATAGDVDDKAETSWSLDEYMKAIVDWNRSFLFVSPIRQERQLENNKISIGLPPGIQNLGATCYLNTQLQCLAQIPAFLDGIFSWRVVNSSHNMNPVMTNLQKLLAKMLVGGERKMSTQDFSDALRLEHYEQQDPNEFGRLLFDRMEESFQQCGSVADGDCSNNRDVGDLSQLLERIFRGTTTYETTCKNCGKTSARSEDFTDLNLPIVRRPSQKAEDFVSESAGDNAKGDHSGRTKKRTKGLVDTAFGKTADTDVQYCFDKYATAEVLEGDNQYHCSYCDSKQDAERVLRLTKLPPVLNVQLSRYVFDRVKLVKEKLMDKVLLPKILTIGRQKDSPTDSAKQLKEKQYVLCAVMRHQGTSAHSGHYIAEAIDWTTGLWYEFNDETVKVLPQGPSCSYVPIITRECSSTERDSVSMENESMSFWNGSQEAYSGSVSGSQDAYNMYYVDEDYFARNALHALVRRQQSIFNASVKNTQSKIGVLSEVVRERETRYSVLSEMCLTDWKTSDRLRRRRAGIRKSMFKDPSSLFRQEDENLEKSTYFWVDGEIFRRFLECTPDLDEQLRSRKALVCPESLVCPHGGLHPRTARRGKLLRNELYSAYVCLLKGERKLLQNTGSDADVSDVVGTVIEASSDLYCTECSASYQIALAKNLDFVKGVKDLYFALEEEVDTAAHNSQLYYNTSNEGCPEEQFAYVMSRSSTTNFKKKAAALMKSFAGFDEGGPSDRSSSSSSTIQLCGLDELEIESFFLSAGASSFTQCREVPESHRVNEIEKRFNGNITCIHGNCIDSHNKRMVRYVPWKIWSLVKKVFPDAVEHRRLRMSDEDNNDSPILEDDGCPLCQKEKDSTKSLKNWIEIWARETRDSPLLKKLLDANRTATREIAGHNFERAECGSRLVHCDDISNWRKSVMSAARICKRKFSDSYELKLYIENLALPRNEALGSRSDPVGRLLQSLRPLICDEHKLVIKGAVFQRSDEGAGGNQYHQLSPSIVILSSGEHDAYTSSLSKLLAILYENCGNSYGADMSLIRDEYQMNEQIQKTTRHSYHPQIAVLPENEVVMNDVLLLSLEGSSKSFSIFPAVCECRTCLNEYVSLYQQNQSEEEECVEKVPNDGNETVNNFLRRLGLASDPIVVESDNEEGKMNTHKMRVFEFNAVSSVKDAADSLREASGSPQDGEVEMQPSSIFLRRSSRKRKTRFPTGCILREDSIDINLGHNMAAVRLLLFEKCEVPLAESMVYIVNLNSCDPLIIDVTTASSEKSLEDIIDQKRDENNSGGLNPLENFMILYKNLEKDDSRDLHETLIESLLQAANLELSEISSDSKGKRKRQSERGFQGTLLQSSSSIAASSNSCEDAIDKVESVETEPKKRSRSDTIQVSDDEKDDQFQPQSVSGDKIENLTDSSNGSPMGKEVGKKSSAFDCDRESVERNVKPLSSSTKGVTEDMINERCLPNGKLVVPERYLRSNQVDLTPGDDDFTTNLASNWAASNHPCASSADQSRLQLEKDTQGTLMDEAGEYGVLIREGKEERVSLDEDSVASSPSSENPETDEIVDLRSEQEEKMDYISSLAARLQEITNVEDQSVCWDAVSWSIDRLPYADGKEIVDYAYAKLLSEQELEG